MSESSSTPWPTSGSRLHEGEHDNDLTEGLDLGFDGAEPGMRILTTSDGFQKLSKIHIGLFYKHIKMSDAALKLIEQITEDVSTFRLPTRARAGS